MLDTDLAHRRHFPAIDWFQSFSLYEANVAAHFEKQVAPDWSALRQETRTILQEEAKLREVAEIVGTESLQDADRLLMKVAEDVRRTFLAQNAYTEDAFSTPQMTHQRISGILEGYRKAITHPSSAFGTFSPQGGEKGDHDTPPLEGPSPRLRGEGAEGG
jgi:V/A-type H+-transporting ATPase subunit A